MTMEPGVLLNKDFLTSSCILVQIISIYYRKKYNEKESSTYILRKVAEEEFLKPLDIRYSDFHVIGIAENACGANGVDANTRQNNVAETSNGFVSQLKDVMHIFNDTQIDENNKASASWNLDLLHSGLKGLEPGILNTANGRSKYMPGWNSFATANSLAKILARYSIMPPNSQMIGIHIEEIKTKITK